jgi:hypothetical protein
MSDRQPLQTGSGVTHDHVAKSHHADQHSDDGK